MTNEEVMTVISEAARQLPSALALVLVTDFAVTVTEDGDIDLIYDGEFVSEDIANEIKAAVKDALQTLGHARTIH